MATRVAPNAAVDQCPQFVVGCIYMKATLIHAINTVIVCTSHEQHAGAVGPKIHKYVMLSSTADIGDIS